MTTTKIPNYTAEQTASLVAAYKANPTKETVEAFAVKFGKNAKSIVAKLSREGVYQKAERTDKNGKAIVKKDSLADDIGKMLSMSEGDVESLTKANKTALASILNALKFAAAKVGEPESEPEAEDNDGGMEPEAA